MWLNINIAYLILAHTDPRHIARLANKISEPHNVDVYIHIDKKTDVLPFKQLLIENPSVFFIEERFTISWAAYSSIEATLALMNKAFKQRQYDRYILLQGLDYLLKSNEQIIKFFMENSEVEFIRACKISGSKDKYHANKCECFWFYENPNLLKRGINKLNSIISVRLRKGYIYDNARYDIFWGSAQWAITGECVKYILNFEKIHRRFNKYFKYVFAPDETYFHTIVFNSPFSQNTFAKGAEPEKQGLVNWRNLHYFEYDNIIKIFTINDYEKLLKSGCLYFRKVTTENSSALLDKIDKKNL